MLNAGSILCGIILTIVPVSAQVGAENRLRAYGEGLVGPPAWFGGAAGAAFGQWRNAPHEWDQGAKGLAERFGSRFAQNIVKQTMQAPLAAALHEDLAYQTSGAQGTGTRLKYALKRSFVVPRSNGRGDTFALSRIAGNFGGGLISRSWQAPSSAGLGWGFLSGGLALAGDVGFNVVREFWPWRRK